MQYRFDTHYVITYTIDGILVVDTDPDDLSGGESLAVALRIAKHTPINILSSKAAAALAMTASVDAAARWLEECEEVHSPGDCPLCGAT